MDKPTIENLFDSLFKFAVNQELRHKGDTKEYGADMGLLVLSRIVQEATDDDENRSYSRLYACRCIKYGNSGDVQHFTEKELMSVSDWNKRKIDQEAESTQMREEIRQSEQEIYKAFGVEKKSRMYLKREDGTTDESTEYRIQGWQEQNGIRALHLIEVGGLTSGDKTVDVSSPDQFIVII